MLAVISSKIATEFLDIKTKFVGSLIYDNLRMGMYLYYSVQCNWNVKNIFLQLLDSLLHVIVNSSTLF